MATKKPDPDATDRHKHNVLSLRPPPAIRALIERLAKAERRSRAQVALILIEEALAARGMMPSAG